MPYDEEIAGSWLRGFQSMDLSSPADDSTNEGQGESTNEGNEESTMDESLVDVVAGQVFREAQDGEAQDIADETSVSGSESASDDIAQLETLSHGSAQVVEDDAEEAVDTNFGFCHSAGRKYLRDEFLRGNQCHALLASINSSISPIPAIHL